jgi:hypothetical protein
MRSLVLFCAAAMLAAPVACTSTETEAPAAVAPKLPAYGTTLAPGAGITSSGKGWAKFTYDAATHILHYDVFYEGLTGPSTAAHIHGPAEPGKNAPPVVPFQNTGSWFGGNTTITDAQAADLDAGKWYVNVHTAANPGGEIRGQIVKQ